MNEKIKNNWFVLFLVWLVKSRKVKIAVVAVIGAIFAYRAGDIPVDVLVDNCLELAAILILAIAGEDMATKIASKNNVEK